MVHGHLANRWFRCCEPRRLAICTELRIPPFISIVFWPTSSTSFLLSYFYFFYYYFYSFSFSLSCSIFIYTAIYFSNFFYLVYILLWFYLFIFLFNLTNPFSSSRSINARLYDDGVRNTIMKRPAGHRDSIYTNKGGLVSDTWTKNI